MELLKFSFTNSKLGKLASWLGFGKKEVAGFDIPAGHTCPAADMCFAYADRITGKITDGANQKVRCYAASIEAAFSSARKAHWYNLDLLNACSDMAELIERSLPKGIKVIRIHSSGDFFSKKYFQAWVKVARNHPEIKFFGYTKVLPYVNADKPDNFRLVYSYGGKLDKYLKGEPTAYIVNDKLEAIGRNLLVSCEENPADDFGYIQSGLSFALVEHGTQPAKNK